MNTQHPGLGLLGSPNIVIKRKFRWVVQLFKERKEVKSLQFVKVNGRPDYQPSREPPHLPDLDHFYDWGFGCWINKEKKEGDWTVEDLKGFDEIVLTLLDGCGAEVEKWVIGDITMKPWSENGPQGVQLNEAMAEDWADYYEVTFNCCTRNYEDKTKEWVKTKTYTSQTNEVPNPNLPPNNR